MADDRYCVIGAGAAGLGTMEVLQRHGLAFDCFEQSDRLGGHWHTDYESLHLITSRDLSGFAGYPMPSDYPVYPAATRCANTSSASRPRPACGRMCASVCASSGSSRSAATAGAFRPPTARRVSTPVCSFATGTCASRTGRRIRLAREGASVIAADVTDAPGAPPPNRLRADALAVTSRHSTSPTPTTGPKPSPSAWTCSSTTPGSST